MPNQGHIIIPMPVQLRLQAEWHEFEAAKKVWRRGERKRMSGRVKEIRNLPFLNDKGETVRWNPLQVAVFALLADGVVFGYDVIRVVTECAPDEPGHVGWAEMDFSIAQLKPLVQKDSIFFSDVMHGRVRLEDEAINTMPQDWVMTPDGTFAPG